MYNKLRQKSSYKVKREMNRDKLGKTTERRERNKRDILRKGKNIRVLFNMHGTIHLPTTSSYSYPPGNNP